MKLWIPREKAENRLKLHIVSSLLNFFSLHFSQTTTSFTLKILPTKVKEITDYCTITAIKEEVLMLCQHAISRNTGSISTTALKQQLTELFSCPDVQVQSSSTSI